jgi:ABC-type uncharacterized transport system ATPase subunit
VQRITSYPGYVEVTLGEGSDAQELLRDATQRLRISRFEIMEPSMHDIFVEKVEASGGTVPEPDEAAPGLIDATGARA